jgi:Skp family chaperone for outer membrane proteins
MKSRATAFICLLGVTVLFFTHQYSAAQQTVKPGANIGVVSIEKVLRECKATVEYKKQLETENKATNDKMSNLTKDIQELTKVLNSGAFIKGSPDFLSRYRELITKQAELKVEDECLSQERTAKYSQYTQQIYQKIIQITKELAEKKGLYLVLSTEEPAFPISNYDELMSTMTTHKVMYSNGCVDLTKDVIDRLDSEQQSDKTKK